MSALRAMRLRGRRKGQGLVELALAMPLLLLLVLGVVEFARAWNIHQVLTDAAREGARTLVVSTWTPAVTADSVTAVVSRAIARAGVNPANATITIAQGAQSGQPGTVSIEMPHRLRVIQGLIGWTTADATFTLRTTTTMRTE